MWACACFVLARLGQLGGGGDPAPILVVGMVLTGTLGYLASAHKHDRIVGGRLNNLREIAEIHEYAVDCVRRRRELAGMEIAKIRDQYAAWIDCGLADEEDGDAPTAVEQASRATRGKVLHPLRAAAVHPTAVTAPAGQLAETELRKSLRRRLLNEAERAFRRMVSLHSRSPVAYLMAAQFFSHAHKHRFLEMLFLERAAGLSSSPDLRFFIHQVRAQLQRVLPTRAQPGTNRACVNAAPAAASRNRHGRLGGGRRRPDQHR